MPNTKLPSRLLDTSAVPALNVTGDLTVDTTTLRVDSTNNKVGVGIASPAQKLHVQNASGATLVRTEVAAGSLVGFNIKKTGSTTQEWNIVDGASVNGRLQIQDVTDNRIDMTFDGTGKVGIGVTDPDAKLEIKGSGGGTGLTFKTTDASSNEVFYVQDGGRAGLNYYPFTIGIPSGTAHASNARFQVEEAGLLTVLTNGNVGIGTTSPSCLLDITKAGEARLKVTSTNANWAGLDLQSHGTQSNYIFFRDESAERARIQVLNDMDIAFSSGSSPSEKFRIQNSTGYLVAQSEAQVRLVLGSTGNSSNNTSNWIRGNGTALGLNSGGGDITFEVNGAEKLQIDGATGRVGIGTTAPNSMIEVSYGDNASTQRWSYSAARTSFYLELDTFIPSGGVVAYSFDMKNNNNAYNNNLVLDRGKVGIGTASPDYQLDIENSSHAVMRLHAGTDKSASLRLKNNAQDWDVNCQTNDNFAVYNQTNSTQPFRIFPTAQGGAISHTLGGHSVGHGNAGEVNNSGCKVLGWYNANAHSSNNYLHLVTSLWGGGSPHGNSEYIMGGFEITGHAYATNTSHGKCNVFFHNWSGSVASGYSLSYTGAYTGFALVYVNSSGYVTVRLAAGSYKAYWLDLFQAGHYPMRTINVTAATFSDSTGL